MNVKASLGAVFTLNGLVWLPLLIGLAGLMLCATAAYVALVPQVGTALAALVTGLALLLIAGGFAFWLRRMLSPKPAVPSEEPEKPAAEQALQPVIGESAAEWVKANTALTAVAALSAGAILAASPSTRRLIARALGPMVLRSAVKTLKSMSDD